MDTYFIWGGFLLFVALMVALDLGVFHRHAHTVRIREALVWTAVWITVSLLFTGVVYALYQYNLWGVRLSSSEDPGWQASVEYLTGYVIEKSLSMDNIFVMAVIFSYFRVPSAHQHRLLFWGILGAVILRGVMIALGAALINSFGWVMMFIFGGLLIVSATKMLFTNEQEIHPEKNLLLLAARRLFPVSAKYDKGRFFTQIDGVRHATPMFLALLMVESSDVMFAVDSIPAIFAVTKDPFLVFTSNVFAILGLRSLYFALAGLMDRFRYLKYSLVAVLAFVGVKMILAGMEELGWIHFEIPTLVSLPIIAAMLLIGIVASMLITQHEHHDDESDDESTVEKAGPEEAGDPMDAPSESGAR